MSGQLISYTFHVMFDESVPGIITVYELCYSKRLQNLKHLNQRRILLRANSNESSLSNMALLTSKSSCK